MIDYTDVDRRLIYKDRSNIDDFKVNEMSARPEHPFYNRLITERFMLLSDDAAKYALDIFNDAYYICTLFYMLDHPLSYLGKLRNKIITKCKGKYLSTATMSLVYNLLGLEQYGNPWGERRKFVELWLHFIIEDGERHKIFDDFTIAIFPGTQFSKIKYPNTAERFERRDIFEILHAKGYEMICVNDINYVIEEVKRRKPGEEAVSELLAFREKVEACFEEDDILEYSDEDYNVWMRARDKIDAVIGYDEDEDVDDEDVNDGDVDDEDDQDEDDQDEDDEENNEEREMEDNGNEDEGLNKTAPKIFDKRINVKKVADHISKLSSDKVIGKRRWYVIFRVLYFLEWIGSSQKIFIDWVVAHFQWKGKKEFRGVQPEFIHSNPCDWNDVIIEGEDFKKNNEDIGPDYFNFAVSIRDTFVNVDEDGTMHDKDEFLITPKQGGINHKNKWI